MNHSSIFWEVAETSILSLSEVSLDQKMQTSIFSTSERILIAFMKSLIWMKHWKLMWFLSILSITLKMQGPTLESQMENILKQPTTPKRSMRLTNDHGYVVKKKQGTQHHLIKSLQSLSHYNSIRIGSTPPQDLVLRKRKTPSPSPLSTTPVQTTWNFPKVLVGKVTSLPNIPE